MPRPPSYQKVNPAEQAVLYLALDSSTLPMYKVNEYADTQLAQRISMVSGVSRVQVFGAQKYAVRVQVDPDKLAALSHPGIHATRDTIVKVPLAVKQPTNPATSLSSATLYAFRIAASFAVI